MRLIDAPVGVFRFNNELVLKTEYSKKYGNVYCPECYILSSGEMFWGGMETIEDFETKYNYLEVEPVNINLGQEPTIHPEPHYDEWCDSCKEYDKEKHSCPRWNKVIKSTVEELKFAQPELCEDAVSRLGAISHFRGIADATSSKEKYNEGFVDGLEFCIAHLSTMPTVTPKQRTGYWIDDGSELGCQCSECGKSLDEYIHATECMTLIEIPKLCPNCGVKMKGTTDADTDTISKCK